MIFIRGFPLWKGRCDEDEFGYWDLRVWAEDGVAGKKGLMKGEEKDGRKEGKKEGMFSRTKH